MVFEPQAIDTTRSRFGNSGRNMTLKRKATAVASVARTTEQRTQQRRQATDNKQQQQQQQQTKIQTS